MSSNVPFNIVSICNDHGDVAGSGVLINVKPEGLCVLTCAHVLNIARGYDAYSQEYHQNTKIQFRTIDQDGLLSGEVIACHPPKDEVLELSDPSDIALLRVVSEYIPKSSAYAWDDLRSTTISDGLVRCFGYSTSTGKHVKARLDGQDAIGRLQLSSEGDQKVFIDSGFSGTPLFDSSYSKIIGIVVSISKDESEQVAYALPVRNIWAACPQLASPYKGLAEFEEADAEFFCGREAIVKKLESVVKEHKIIGVTADSGLGKSSVVKAGLIPKLRASRDWCIIQLRPDKNPWNSLAIALDEIRFPDALKYERQKTRNKLAKRLKEDSSHLTEYLEEYFESDDSFNKVIILVNQFEELFTLAGHGKNYEETEGDDSAKVISPDIDFRDLMVETVRLNGEPSIQWIFTLRADFSGPAFRHPEFNETMGDGNINLPEMYSNELRDAIRKPAELLNVEFEAGQKIIDVNLDDQLTEEEKKISAERCKSLDERIADAVDGKPESLPLMSHLLQKLWEKIDNRQLTHDAYDELGGLGGALDKHAEVIYRAFDKKQQENMRKLFYSLVRIGDDNGEITRQIKAREELDEDQWLIAKELAKEGNRLLTIRGDEHQQTVEVAHESLLLNWKTLKIWVRQKRAFLLWRQRLEISLKQYEDSKAKSDLLQDKRLTEAERYEQSVYNSLLSENEGNYIRKSRDVAKAKVTIRNWLVAGAFVIMSGLLGMFIYLFLTTEKQKELANTNLSKRLGSYASKQAHDGEKILPVSIAMEAFSDHQTGKNYAEEPKQALAYTLNNLFLSKNIEESDYGFILLPKKNLLLVEVSYEEVYLFNILDETFKLIELPQGLNFSSIIVSPNENYFFYNLDIEDSVFSYNLKTGGTKKLFEYNLNPEFSDALKFSKNSDQILAFTDENKIILGTYSDGEVSDIKDLLSLDDNIGIDEFGFINDLNMVFVSTKVTDPDEAFEVEFWKSSDDQKIQSNLKENFPVVEIVKSRQEIAVLTEAYVAYYDDFMNLFQGNHSEVINFDEVEIIGEEDRRINLNDITESSIKFLKETKYISFKLDKELYIVDLQSKKATVYDDDSLQNLMVETNSSMMQNGEYFAIKDGKFFKRNLLINEEIEIKFEIKAPVNQLFFEEAWRKIVLVDMSNKFYVSDLFGNIITGPHSLPNPKENRKQDVDLPNDLIGLTNDDLINVDMQYPISNDKPLQLKSSLGEKAVISIAEESSVGVVINALGDLVILDLEKWQYQSEVIRAESWEARFNFAQISPDGSKIFTVSTDGSLRVWNLRTRLRNCSLSVIDDNEENLSLMKASFSSNGDILVYSFGNEIVNIVTHINDKKCIETKRSINNNSHIGDGARVVTNGELEISDIIISAIDDTVVILTNEGYITKWSIEPIKKIGEKLLFEKEINLDFYVTKIISLETSDNYLVLINNEIFVLDSNSLEIKQKLLEDESANSEYYNFNDVVNLQDDLLLFTTRQGELIALKILTGQVLARWPFTRYADFQLERFNSNSIAALISTYTILEDNYGETYEQGFQLSKLGFTSLDELISLVKKSDIPCLSVDQRIDLSLEVADIHEEDPEYCKKTKELP